MRKKREDIIALRSARIRYVLGKNQYFCETPKAYEIWDTKPLLKRLIRFDKHRIFL